MGSHLHTRQYSVLGQVACINYSSSVGWLKVDSQTILTIQKRVVTHNSRIAVTHDEHRTWNLHIRNVREKDRGCYMCQINTPVMKNQVGCIEVHGEDIIT
ncbi:hypothetical protein HAZT_HAZT002805 [Hyalella azteca]|uniref:Immunoglobulin-like beta-sandwich domain-containing protein n=1 Tax=Hyalella azteca TaxID=294128 RepID=A0A6A0HCQ0_HYAAZ|nr:hypothetical protein HAZT_HAZT002805 [Hyalella azteca]